MTDKPIETKPIPDRRSLKDRRTNDDAAGDRRTGEDRRAGDDQTADNQRSGDDRRADDPADGDRRAGETRRGMEDRRGIHFTFKFINEEEVENLRQWLDEHCEGEYKIGIPDMETARKWGNFRVRFERESDLAKLAKLLGVHWPSWMG